MKTSIAFTLAACAISSPAAACQPPRDMPSDPAAAAEYWERARNSWERHVISTVPTLVVVKVSSRLGDEAPEVVAPNSPHRFGLTVLKALRGTPAQKLAGEYANHMCDDFKVGVALGGVYLLAMSGERIIVAVPLAEGQERAGVDQFFARIGKATAWE